MNKSQLLSYFFILVFAAVLFSVSRILMPFMTPIFWSAILVFAVHPIYVPWRRRFGKHESVAAITFTLLLILVLLPPVSLLLFKVVQQAIELAQTTINFVNGNGIEDLIIQLKSSDRFEKAREMALWLEPYKKQIANGLLDWGKGFGNQMAQQVGSMTTNLISVLINGFLMIMLLYEFLRHGERIIEFMFASIPLEKDDKMQIMNVINQSLSAVIRGQLMTSFAQAIITGILFTWLGLDIPFIFAAITFMASLIPIIGASAVWIPMVAFLLMTGSITKGVILLVCGVFIISMVDNVIKPWIIGEKTKLPFLLLFFGIMGGLQTFGISGIVLAPVLLTLFFSLIQIYRGRYMQSDEETGP